MTKEDQVILQRTETRVRQLILLYQELHAENEALRNALDKKKDEVEGLQEQCATLRKDYADLKLAKMIEISNADLEGAKARLSKLAREVNKCIALMSV